MKKRFTSYARYLEEIREAIHFNGFTINDIADALHMNRVSLSRKLNDNKGRLYAEELFAIAKYVGKEGMFLF